MKNNTPWAITIALVVVIIAGVFWYSGGYSSKPGEYNTFASCIAESGAKFYGAFWCPHCQTQKEIFGSSAKNLPYVECSLPNGSGQMKVCADNNIESYPTWVFADGTRETGQLSMEELAEKTQCVLAKDSI